MVYRGKISAACQPCRQRRTRCDLLSKGCSSCSRLGTKCFGYRDTTSIRFLLEKIPATATLERVVPPKSRKNVTSTGISRVSTPEACVPQSPALTPGSRERNTAPACPPQQHIIPSGLKTPIFLPLSGPLAGGIPISDYQRQAYSFFTRKAAVQLQLKMPAGKWSQLALQLSASAPVFFGIAALGGVFRSLVQRTHVGFVKPACDDQSALEEYGRAMVALHRALAAAGSEDGVALEHVLVTCLIFVSFELIQNNGRTALAHLRLGRRLAGANQNGNGTGLLPRCTKTSSELLSLFDELDEDRAVCEPADRLLPKETKQGQCWEVQAEPSNRLYAAAAASSLMPGIPSAFENLADARVHLDLLVDAGDEVRANILNIAQKVSASRYPVATAAYRDCVDQCLARVVDLPGELITRMHLLQEAHAAWMTKYIQMESEYEKQSWITLMEVQHFYSTFLLATCRETEECLTDRFVAGFIRALHLCERYIVETASESLPLQKTPNQSLNGKILPTLFLVASKCRDAAVRRRAVKILRDGEWSENFQTSRRLAGFAEWMIGAEEKRAMDIKEDVFDGTVPEAARFCDVVVEAKYSEPNDVRFVLGRFISRGKGRELEVVEERREGDSLEILYLGNL